MPEPVIRVESGPLDSEQRANLQEYGYAAVSPDGSWPGDSSDPLHNVLDVGPNWIDVEAQPFQS